MKPSALVKTAPRVRGDVLYVVIGVGKFVTVEPPPTSSHVMVRLPAGCCPGRFPLSGPRAVRNAFTTDWTVVRSPATEYRVKGVLPLRTAGVTSPHAHTAATQR